MDRVEELILDLSWYKTEEEILRAQRELSNILTVGTLHRMIPFLKYPKGYWDGMAGVIGLCGEKMDISENEKLINDIFEWMQDMNWPGAVKISEVIKKLDRGLIIKQIEWIVENDCDDPEWLYFLTDFVVVELGLKEWEFKSKRNYEVLMKTL